MDQGRPPLSATLTPEDLEAIKARDTRFREIELGLEVQEALQHNRPLWVLMSKLRSDADAALEELMTVFATANPNDTNLIMGLQARVFRFRYAFETLNAILTQGDIAERQVRAEDQIERERYD